MGIFGNKRRFVHCCTVTMLYWYGNSNSHAMILFLFGTNEKSNLSRSTLWTIRSLYLFLRVGESTICLLDSSVENGIMNLRQCYEFWKTETRDNISGEFTRYFKNGFRPQALDSVSGGCVEKHVEVVSLLPGLWNVLQIFLFVVETTVVHMTISIICSI